MNENSVRLSYRLMALLMGALGMQVGVAQVPASAATATVSADELQEVVVTGSRLAGTSTFSTPTPVTSLTVEELQVSSTSTLAAGLQTLPSIVPGGGPTAGGGTANGGQNFLNLRGLGTDRTLTLLDGRRFTSAGPTGQVDTNLIPQGLVERVDVVTGGASAAYGSDAVGGVINFVLDKNFSGIKANISHGSSMHGDNDETKFSLTGGMRYAGGRGHVVAGAEYFTSEGLDGSAREFRRTAGNLITNPSGLPSLVTASDVRTPYTDGGMIVIGAGGTAANNASFMGTQFGPAGAPIPYSYGTIASDIGVPGGSQNGGDGLRVSTGQEIIRPLDRQTLFVHTDFELTDNISSFVEGSYGWTESAFQSSPITRTLTIQRDNAYLATAAPSIVARMTSLAVPRLTVNRTIREAGVSLNVNKNITRRYVVGLEGKLGEKWNWGASYQQGENYNRNYMDPNLVTGNLTLAVDAVVNPANGTIVCRSTLTAPTNGCVPFNPFGAGSPSAAALDYVMGRSDFVTVTKQTFAEASVTGEAFQLPAGPMAVALGAEYRKESARTIADTLSNAGAYRLVNQQDFFGAFNITEFFAETQVPLLADKPLARNLDMNVAARHTDYSTSGTVDTWKVGLNWRLIDDLRLRATYSRDIRAPNLTELFATGRQNNITVVDSLTNRTYLSVPNRTFGNVNLKPEEATTTVVGVVYQPKALPDFRMAVDFWRVRIDDAIGNVGGQNAVNQCNLSNQSSPICSFVTRDTARAVIATQTAPANLTVQKTHGVDIEASYRVRNLSLRMLAGYVGENIIISPLVPVPFDDAGTNTGSQPNWRGTLSTTYARGPWSGTLQTRYIGGMTWDPARDVLGVDTDFNYVKANVYWDGQLSFQPGWSDGHQTIYLNVQNILDKDPPFAPSTGGATPLPTNTALFDQVGRMFRLGIRFEY